MKADQKMFRPKWKQIIFLICPKCRKTFMMIVHLKRGERVYLTTTSAFCIEISNTIEDFMWKGNSYYIIKLTVEKYSLSEDQKFIRHQKILDFQNLKFSHNFCIGVNDFKNKIHICAALQSIPVHNQTIRELVRRVCSSSKRTTTKYTTLMNCSLVQGIQ